MAKRLFELYLRKDKSVKELLDLAKEKYYDPLKPISTGSHRGANHQDDGQNDGQDDKSDGDKYICNGVVIAAINLDIQDYTCYLPYACSECKYPVFLVHYESGDQGKQEELLCGSCIDKKSEQHEQDDDDDNKLTDDVRVAEYIKRFKNQQRLEEEKKWKKVDFSQYVCNLCATEQDDEYLYRCSSDSCSCDYKLCQPCAESLTMLDCLLPRADDVDIDYKIMTPRLPKDICNIIFGYILFPSSSASAWYNEKKNIDRELNEKRSPECLAKPLKLDSKFMSSQVLDSFVKSLFSTGDAGTKKYNIPQKSITDDCRQGIEEIVEVADEWIDNVTGNDKKNYRLTWLSDDNWPSDIKIILHYAGSSFPTVETICPVIASHLTPYISIIKSFAKEVGLISEKELAKIQINNRPSEYLGSISFYDNYVYDHTSSGGQESDLLSVYENAFTIVKQDHKKWLPNLTDEEVLHLDNFSGQNCLAFTLHKKVAEKPKKIKSKLLAEEKKTRKEEKKKLKKQEQQEEKASAADENNFENLFK
jgi:hypothetical protein